MTPAPVDNRTSQVRAQSARLIENVIKAHAGKREIEVLLAIGRQAMQVLERAA